MRRWLDTGWYRYLWGQANSDQRAGVVVACVIALGVAGFATLEALPGGSAPSFVAVSTTELNIHPAATKATGGRATTMTRIIERPRLVTQTVSVPRTVTRTEVRYSAGKSTDVTETKTVVQPQSAVTQSMTVTSVATVTQPVTVDGPSHTDVVTVTRTVTAPAFTVNLVTVTVQVP